MISLSPDDVETLFERLGIPNRFTADEKKRLKTTPVVAQDGDVIAFATPEERFGLNILGLRKIRGTTPTAQPAFFDDSWYLNEDFARQDCPPGWHFLHENVIPDSVSKPVNYLSSVRTKMLELPWAIEIALMLFLHYSGTGVQLLHKKHTWCRDQASLNRFVTLGAFGKNGLFISSHAGNYESRGLGVCAKVRRSCDGASSDQPGS
jgi:hypothetical protein